MTMLPAQAHQNHNHLSSKPNSVFYGGAVGCNFNNIHPHPSHVLMATPPSLPDHHHHPPPYSYGFPISNNTPSSDTHHPPTSYTTTQPDPTNTNFYFLLGSPPNTHLHNHINMVDQDRSPTSISNSVNQAETGPSNKDHRQQGTSTDSWLQIGLATSHPSPITQPQPHPTPHIGLGGSTSTSHGLMLELNLGGATSSTTTSHPPQQHHHPSLLHQTDTAWGFITPLHHQRPSSSFFPPSLSPSASSSSGSVMPFIVPTSNFRVVDPPPRRPHSGIWFMLQASQHQGREPFLPQVSKSFLRIKDGRMTVRLVMKYLANKLGLDSESEVEVRCRGQQLVPLMTLQNVRDNIWSSRDVVTLLPDSSTSDHVMVLHYGRSCSP